MIKDSLVWRFWNKFTRPKVGCWEWFAAKDHFGYGQIGRYGRRNLIRAHRLSWLLFNGPIPDSLCVLHRCDNPSCVNPNHLFLGTKKDNAIDKAKKGRSYSPRGETNGRAILNEKKVKSIRKFHKNGILCKDLSLMFNTPVSTIYKVVYRVTWKHI